MSTVYLYIYIYNTYIDAAGNYWSEEGFCATTGYVPAVAVLGIDKGFVIVSCTRQGIN